ncbi:Putative cytoplasmic protein [Citrobacter freundii]|uniref:Cytoplasmic protein n=1 Tax=Citrobacter freundii TaxID=546 RepID=A0A7G2IU38_CITFR|nr:Putative cytoplasmic protein [Citrobacter freundii]
MMVIEAGQFGVFPPEKWHNIEVMTDDTYFNIDFFVAPEVLMESANQRKSRAYRQGVNHGQSNLYRNSDQ